MTEFSADELKNLKVTENISEEQAGEVRERTLIHLRGVQEVDSYELRFKTKNGVWRWFDVNSGLINFEGDHAVIGTAVDVTARKQREHEMEVIAQISEILRLNTSLNEISSAILEKIPDFLNVDAALICLDNKRESELLQYHGVGAWKALEGITLPRGQGLASHVMDFGKLYVNRVPASDPFFNFPELAQSMATLAGVPMIAQGKTLGALIVGSEHPMAEFELRLLTTVADITANGLQRASLYDQSL
jgi:PAS domain S-box-containing protein